MKNLKLQILIIVSIFSIALCDYAPSPQNPFVNTTYSPPPPPLNNSQPYGFTPHSPALYFRKVVIPLIGLVALFCTGIIGIIIWCLVKIFKRKKMEGQRRGRTTTTSAAWPTWIIWIVFDSKFYKFYVICFPKY